MNLCDISYVKGLLNRHSFRFSRSLGQNFLTGEWVPEKTAAMCGADNNTGVFEIGPGIGTLTHSLAKYAGKVVSVEIDRSLLPILDETLSGLSNVKVINADVMKLDIRDIIRREFGDMPVVACANLPYYITSPVLSVLLEAGCFKKITVMVQKEVAERIAAKAGDSEYGAFTVFVNYFADPVILFEVPRECFIPVPNVDSAVIQLNIKDKPDFEVEDKDFYFRVVHTAFGQRRKTLLNALNSGFGELGKEELVNVIETCGFRADIRGERLSPSDFAQLSAVLSARLHKQLQNER